MQEKFDTHFKNVLTHAYCIEGTRETVPLVEKYIRTLLGDGAHILTHEFALFSVEDGRTLSASASVRATAENQYVEIIYADSFSVESQNALLKAIEEPAPYTHYIFVTPRLDKILPTILSRSVSFSLIDTTISDATLLEVKEFLAGGRSSRMTIVARYLKDLEDEEGETTRRAFDLFFERIISHVSTVTSADSGKALRVLMDARKFIRDKGSSGKMIAEYVALMLPEHFK